MTEQRKNAYRYLLYWAMLDIRNKCQPRLHESWNPLVWHKQYWQSRAAGGIADWLHNLALYAANDFCGFDEDWFWREYKHLSNGSPDVDFKHYQTVFESRIAMPTRQQVQ
jgi:hypothetical protein